MTVTAAPTPEGYHLLTVTEHLWMAITGCRDHRWSWPQMSREQDWQRIYVANAPYDSHQQCPVCGAMRLFDSKLMDGGPLFSKDVKQHG